MKITGIYRTKLELLGNTFFIILGFLFFIFILSAHNEFYWFAIPLYLGIIIYSLVTKTTSSVEIIDDTIKITQFNFQKKYNLNFKIDNSLKFKLGKKNIKSTTYYFISVSQNRKKVYSISAQDNFQNEDVEKIWIYISTNYLQNIIESNTTFKKNNLQKTVWWSK